MSKNDQAHFKNLAGNAVRFLKGVWPFWHIMHYRVYTSLINDKSLLDYII